MSDAVETAELKPGKQLVKNKKPMLAEAPESEVAKLKREAQEAAQKDGELRAKACGAELAPILERHRCVIIGQPHFKHMGEGVWGTVTEAIIVAKP